MLIFSASLLLSYPLSSWFMLMHLNVSCSYSDIPFDVVSISFPSLTMNFRIIEFVYICCCCDEWRFLIFSKKKKNHNFLFELYRGHYDFLLKLRFWNNRRIFAMNTKHVSKNNAINDTTNAINVNDSGSLASSMWFSSSSQCSASTFVPFGTGHGCWTIISCRCT